MRVDGRDRGRHGDHRFQRVAAFGENRAPGFGGSVMGSGNDAAPMSGGVEIHGTDAQ
jgi:hypothetical protein